MGWFIRNMFQTAYMFSGFDTRNVPERDKIIKKKHGRNLTL
jgi:hypothetical protein